MLKGATGIVMLALFLSGCKTTQRAPNSNSQISDIRTGYYTLKTRITIAPVLQQALNAATGQDMCFGEVYNDSNTSTVGIFLCAHGPNDLRPGTGLFFEMADNRVRYFGATVGTIQVNTGERFLNSLCNGDYENLCRIWYDTEHAGLKYEFTGTFDTNQWQFQVVKTFKPRKSLNQYLSQIDGHRICLGELKHNIGSDYGLFICDNADQRELNPNQVVLLNWIGNPDPIQKVKIGRNGIAYGEIGPFPRSNVFRDPRRQLSPILSQDPYAGLSTYTPKQLDTICHAGFGQQKWDRNSAILMNHDAVSQYLYVPTDDGGLDLQFLRKTPSLHEITCVPYHNDEINVSDFCNDRTHWSCEVHVRDGKLVIDEKF